VKHQEKCLERRGLEKDTVVIERIRVSIQVVERVRYVGRV